MSTYNSKKIRKSLNNMSSRLNILSANVNNIQYQKNKITQNITELENCNGHPTGKTQTEMKKDLSFEYNYVWEISINNMNLSDIDTSVSNIKNKIQQVVQIIKNYESTLDQVDKEIKNMELNLSDLSEEERKALFDGVTSSAAAAAAGTFLSSDKILTEYWNASLKFKWDKTKGAYIITKDGVPMGWTSKEVATTILSNHTTTTPYQDGTQPQKKEEENNSSQTKTQTKKEYKDMTWEERLNSGLDPTMNSKNSRLDYSRTNSAHWTTGEKAAAVIGVGSVAGILGPELAATGAAASSGGSGTTALSTTSSGTTTVSTSTAATSSSGTTSTSLATIKNETTAVSTTSKAASSASQGASSASKAASSASQGASNNLKVAEEIAKKATSKKEIHEALKYIEKEGLTNDPKARDILTNLSDKLKKIKGNNSTYFDNNYGN